MPKIVAIGGGEIGRTGYPIETTSIDQEIIKLSGKRNPKLLFIPTATNDSTEYIAAVKRQFGDRLGCSIDNLLLILENNTHSECKEKILSADIIYVGGGDTEFMLEIWKQKGVDELLKEAYRQDIVLSGLSAGAICWFLGTHDEKKASLGLIDAYFCPHYDERNSKFKGSQQQFIDFLRDKENFGLGVGDCTAIEIVDDRYRILSSADFSMAEKIWWENGVCHRIALPVGAITL